MKTRILLLSVLLVGLWGCRQTTRGYVSLGGEDRLYYEERGQGDPLILLHGHSLDTRMWDAQFGEFSKQYRCIRFDFRGYGQSSPQREDLPMTHVDDLLALMDALQIEKAHIIGLSMGAFVAGDMLAVCPERMLSCTLVSGGIRNTPGPSQPMDSVESARRDQEIAELKIRGIELYKKEWIEALMASGGSQRERMRKPLEQMIGDWSAWQPLHKEVRLFYGKEAWDLLRQRGMTDVPTLIVKGENDVKDPSRLPREMDYLSHVSYVVLPDCGHMLNMDQPEAFNALVLDFLQEIQ